MEKKTRKNSDARIRANAKYDASHTTRYSLKLNNDYDADAVEKLKSVPNVQRYLKDLIKADIAKSNSLTLKEYLAVMDNGIAITIHQEGEYDGDYLYVSDIEEDLLNRTVIKVETGLPNKTDLRISIK